MGRAAGEPVTCHMELTGIWINIASCLASEMWVTAPISQSRDVYKEGSAYEGLNV